LLYLIVRLVWAWLISKTVINSEAHLRMVAPAASAPWSTTTLCLAAMAKSLKKLAMKAIGRRASAKARVRSPGLMALPSTVHGKTICVLKVKWGSKMAIFTLALSKTTRCTVRVNYSSHQVSYSRANSKMATVTVWASWCTQTAISTWANIRLSREKATVR